MFAIVAYLWLSDLLTCCRPCCVLSCPLCATDYHDVGWAAGEQLRLLPSAALIS